ncbi:response regulator transcription factor [Paenibacillus thalictri]|uniref:response regulator transcription factor n=1 Tax=Paenibacillus thalictri TaxID=2527873 RepID=UPI0013EF593B|nr:response regulator transcription factor [Paenibacillus thalictri]
MSKATIIVADDQPLIRDGIAAILDMEDNYIVVGKTGDGLATIEQVQLQRPDLVLMDIHMPKLDGLQAAERIKREFPEIKILILTTFEDTEYVWEAMRHGASGYLVKGIETAKMLSIIQDCLDGRINFPASIQQRLAQLLHHPDENEKMNDLSLQERKIAGSLMQGKSNQAIADELFLTTGTVKNYLSSIYKKLSVTSRSEAIAYLHGKEL